MNEPLHTLPPQHGTSLGLLVHAPPLGTHGGDDGGVGGGVGGGGVGGGSVGGVEGGGGAGGEGGGEGGSSFSPYVRTQSRRSRLLGW